MQAAGRTQRAAGRGGRGEDQGVRRIPQVLKAPMPTRYTVTVTPEAVAQLTALWIQASSADRAATSRASGRIDRELREDADQRGHLLAGGSRPSRAIRFPPLRAIFDVSEPDRLVWIRSYALAP